MTKTIDFVPDTLELLRCIGNDWLLIKNLNEYWQYLHKLIFYYIETKWNLLLKSLDKIRATLYLHEKVINRKTV